MDIKSIQQQLDKKANKPCHRCGKTDFSVLTYEFKLTNEEKEITIIVVGCNNCGALILHAKNVLLEKE